MAIAITIPRLGWSMDEGTFGEWVKSDGDAVQAGDVIFSLESDKALQEVESIDEGVLRIVPGGPAEGDTVAVGTLIAWLVEEGEGLPESTDVIEGSGQTLERTSTATSSPDPSLPRVRQRGDSPAISPRALRLARKHGIDWSQLKGSGRTGRIRECDVQAYVARPEQPEAEVHPLHATRRVIADRMMQSVRTTAPVTLTTRVNATNLVALRMQYKATSAEVVPAIHDVITKLCALALAELPDVNRQWSDDGLVDPDGIHIGIAVQTESGLVVPVIRDAATLTLAGIARQSHDLIERARSRQCSAVELSGGTFSISNLGQYGVDTFTPVLNPPQTAILGLGSICRDAVVMDDDRIVAQDRIPLSLTFDHRVVDGAPAAQFLQHLGRMIENPGPCLIQ